MPRFRIIFILSITIIYLNKLIYGNINTISSGNLNWRYNLNYEDTIKYMKQLEQDNVDLIKLISIGKSVQNKDLLLMRLSTDTVSTILDNKEALYNYYKIKRTLLKPSVKLLATIHGNEPLGKQLLLALADYLVTEYRNQNPRIVNLLNSTNIELLPLANPDGFSVTREGDCHGTRWPKHRWNGWSNAHQIDLNTNFRSTLNKDNINSQQIQPEALSIMTWIVSNPSFVLSASIHTGLQVISYPFDSIQTATQDDTLFQTLARNYVINLKHSKTFQNGCTEFERYKDGITNGYAMNPDNIFTKETMADFNYKSTNCLELNLYLSCCKYPNSSQIETEWKNNQESLINFIESAHWGVKGIIIDKNTQDTIKSAVISVNKNGHTITSSTAGEYWRILSPGKYTLFLSAFGYEPVNKTVIISNENPHSALVVNFTMSKLFNGQQEREEEYNYNLPNFRTATIFSHHNYVETEKILKDLNKKYSHISRLYSIGQSVQKRELYVLEITDNPGQHELSEPEFKYIGNMHGNEVVGKEMILLFAKLLLENYGHNSMIDWLINNTRIHLMPSMNPDGYERSRLGDCDSLNGRGNANDVDLNRNFPDQYRTYSENRVQEIETLNMMTWLRQYPFVLSANLHGGALVANYPFDGTNGTIGDYYNGTPDDKLFQHLALVYSRNHPHMHKGHCHKKCADNELSNEYYPNGIINGANWYSLYGGMQDWNYLHTNCFEITVEMGCHKYPQAEELPRLWQENCRPLLAFVAETHRGIKGIIRDALSNGTVPGAEIHVNGSTHTVRSVSPYGDYWRLLLPGIYNVTVTKSGYLPCSRTVLVRNETTPVWLEFLLQPAPHSNLDSENGFVIFLIIILFIFSIIFFLFCMSIVWCPRITALIVNRIKFFSLCNECTFGRLITSSSKPNTFYYSKLNIEDNELFRDFSDDTAEDILN